METEHLCVNASVYVETLSNVKHSETLSNVDLEAIFKLLLTHPSSSSLSSDDISTKSLSHSVEIARNNLQCGDVCHPGHVDATSLAIIVLGRVHKFLPELGLDQYFLFSSIIIFIDKSIILTCLIPCPIHGLKFK